MQIPLPDVITIELPEVIVIPHPFVYLITWSAGIFLGTLILKFTKKGPHIKEGIIAALSILIMYVACVLIYKYNPLGIKRFVAPLPFLKADGDTLLLSVYEYNEKGKLCIPKFFSEVGSLYLLAFLVNQIYNHKPPNLKIPGWLVYRFFSTMFCIGVHYAVYRVMEFGLAKIPEDSLLDQVVPFMPIGILCAILVLCILGSIKKPLGRFYKVVNLAFDGIHTFFNSNPFGKILTRAVCTTCLLTAFGYGLQRICEKYTLATTLPLASVSLLHLDLGGYATLIALFVLWILVGFLM